MKHLRPSHLISKRKRQTLFKHLVIITACFSAYACSLFPTQPQTITDNWHAKGKIGINSEQQKGSAWLDWQQQQDHYTIQLQGPLGLGGMLIDGNTKACDVTYQGKIYPSLRPQQLKQITGLDLPLQHFPYWAQGQVSPFAAVTQQSYQKTELQSLQQAGWTLKFSRYRQIAEKHLPGKLVLQSQGTKLTVIFKYWMYQ